MSKQTVDKEEAQLKNNAKLSSSEDWKFQDFGTFRDTEFEVMM